MGFNSGFKALKAKRDIQPSTSERQIWKYLTNPLHGVQTVLKVWKWLDYSRNALSLLRPNFHNSKSLKRILNQQKQLYAPLYCIYLRTILYHYHNHAQTFSLDRHSNCNFVRVLHLYLACHMQHLTMQI